MIYRSYLLGVRYRDLQENTTLLFALSAEGDNCAAQDDLSVNLTLNGRRLSTWLIHGRRYDRAIIRFCRRIPVVMREFIFIVCKYPILLWTEQSICSCKNTLTRPGRVSIFCRDLLLYLSSGNWKNYLCSRLL